MASYHLSVKIVSRSSGRGAVASAAYRSRSEFKDERLGLSFDYSQKPDLVFSEIIAPKEAPAWVYDRERLWNEVEKAEIRKDAQLFREVEVALPAELSFAQRVALLRSYVEETFVKCGMIADVNMHESEKNPHAHIMLTLREITPTGFGKKVREWNKKENLLAWREGWAVSQNLHLAIAGHDSRVDHRSFKKRGVALQPQIKLGVSGYIDEKAQLERTQEYYEIARANGDRIIEDPGIAIDQLTYHQAVFSRKDVYKFALSHCCDRAQYDRVCQAIFSDPEIVSIGVGLGNEELFTSKSMLAAERNMLEAVGSMASVKGHRVSSRRVEQVFHSSTMSEAQADAYRGVLNSGQCAALVGYAGSGKSYTLGAVREAYESQGYKVRGMALSGMAAESLSVESGIESQTIHRTLYGWEDGRELPDEKTVLVVDEAGMIGTRQMHELTRWAGQSGAKLVLVGDYQQLQPIEAGGSFRGVCERIGYLELSEIRRQNIDWQREATVLLSGVPESVCRAIDRYDENGHIRVEESLEAAKKELIACWQSSMTDPGSKIILAFRNKDVAELNRMAREKMAERGLLKGAPCTFETAKGPAEFCIGDRVIFLRNENSLGVRNGSLGTIEDLDPIGAIAVNLDAGRRVVIDTHFYNDLDYGYAATVHKTQGVTVDRAFVLGTRHFDKHTAYVALSRHREDVRLFVSRDDEGFRDHARMKVLFSRERPKDLIVDYALPRGIKVDISKIYRRKRYQIQVSCQTLPGKDFTKQVSVDPGMNHEEGRAVVGKEAHEFAAKIAARWRIDDVSTMRIQVRRLDPDLGAESQIAKSKAKNDRLPR